MTAVPATMQTAALDRFGGVETIRVRTLPVPVPGPDDVLIRVAAAGVGSWDAAEREGAYDGMFGVASTFPYVLGWDGAGTVAAVGSRVGRFFPGNRVYAASVPMPRGGFYAEYAVVDQEHVAPVPDGLAMEAAGAMPWDALTAVSGLHALGLRAGRTVMILGASGGIGHLAVQLAVRRGARVLAVASGADGVELVSRLGADVAVDGRREDVVAVAGEFAPSGLDAALTTIGGAVADRALSVVRDGGVVACPNGVVPEPRGGSGVRLVRYDGARDQRATARLDHLIATGPFEVHVAATFALGDAADAHRALGRHHVGKVALQIS